MWHHVHANVPVASNQRQDRRPRLHQAVAKARRPTESMSQVHLHILTEHDSDDERLIQALRDGQDGAFANLYHLYVHRVAGVARTFVTPTQVDDVIQDTFVLVFRNINKFRGDSRLATWIHRITVNVCLSELRKQRSRIRTEPFEDIHESSHDPESVWLDQDAGQAMMGLLDQLEPRKRATIYLHHVEGLTAAEIADVLGEQRQAVLKRLQRTREELLDAWHAKQAKVGPSDASQTRGARGQR